MWNGGDVDEIIIHDVNKPLFKVELAGGRTITVTGDHSLFASHKRQRYRAVAVPVNTLDSKDLIATIATLPADQPDRLDVNGVLLTDDLLTFCGLWLADGCYGGKNVIISAGGDDSILDFVYSLSSGYVEQMRDRLNMIMTSTESTVSNQQKGRTQGVVKLLKTRETAFGARMNAKGDIWCHSTNLMHILQELGLVGYSTTKEIPSWVHTLSSPQIGAFLRGYFSGDGCVVNDKGYLGIHASSSSRRMIDQVRVLLLRLGIDSTIIQSSQAKSGFKATGPNWVLSIGRSASRKLFASRVGFIQPAKDQAIQSIKERRKAHPIAWRKVRKISHVKTGGRVYDIAVTGTHRFVTNGILAHNSVRWAKTAVLPESIINGLRKFMSEKKPGDRVFGDVNSSMVNKFLSSIVPGLSAKVFRTYHATEIVENALRAKDVKEASDLDKLQHAREANLKAAEFCNHQRTPPKTWDAAYEKKKQKVDALKAKQNRSEREEERLKKAELDLDFYVRTKNYNLGTSMKNYIDPRIFKSWADRVGLDWATIYTKSLQRKFSWVGRSRREWESEGSNP